MADEFCLKMPDFHVTFRDFLHAVNLRHGTDGFTSLPKKGVLRIFSPWKIWRLRLGLNPRTWVPKASTLPLDHRSRFSVGIVAQATVWTTDELWFDSKQEQENVLFFQVSRQPTSYSMAKREFFFRRTAAVPQADHLLPPNAQLKNMWSSTSISPCLYGVHGDPMAKIFAERVQTGPAAHPVSCIMYSWCVFRQQSGRGVALTTHSNLVPRATPLIPVWAFIALIWLT